MKFKIGKNFTIFFIIINYIKSKLELIIFKFEIRTKTKYTCNDVNS